MAEADVDAWENVTPPEPEATKFAFVWRFLSTGCSIFFSFRKKFKMGHSVHVFFFSQNRA